MNPIQNYKRLDDLFADRMGTYIGKSWRPFLVKFKWDPTIADYMEELSPKRCQKRRDAYLVDKELNRATSSIRFGNVKTGHGYKGDRKDFCLVAGVYQRKNLTLFYRRLELIGGLHFDMVLIREVEEWMGPITTVTIMAVQADIFALARGSNEKLYAQLRQFYEGRK